MREAGVAASRVNHATLTVNGVDYGLYMNIEPLDREFLEDHFADPDGNLYSDGSELATNKKQNDKTRLKALIALIEDEDLDGDHDAFFADMDALVDVDAFLLETAVEAVLPTSSNFTNGYDNYYLYDNPGPGFAVLPWDFDRLFTGSNPVDADPYSNPASGHDADDNWRLRWRALVLDNPA